MQKGARMNQQAAGALIDPAWVIGWLFVIVCIKLIWWQAIIALILWPYYLGVSLRPG
jgi:hypothetical protein